MFKDPFDPKQLAPREPTFCNTSRKHNSPCWRSPLRTHTHSNVNMFGSIGGGLSTIDREFESYKRYVYILENYRNYVLLNTDTVWWLFNYWIRQFTKKGTNYDKYQWRAIKKCYSALNCTKGRVYMSTCIVRYTVFKNNRINTSRH